MSESQQQMKETIRNLSESHSRLQAACEAVHQAELNAPVAEVFPTVRNAVRDLRTAMEASTAPRSLRMNRLTLY